jgi:hypothetical protein
MLLLLCAGCLRGLAGQKIEFVYFNLSTNEIWVVSVAGVPAWASPGRLAPVRGEDQLSEKGSVSFETVRVADKLRIKWQEGGQQGWPGGEYAPRGVSHEAEFKRDELRIPAKLKNGKVRFTYLGGDKWRIKLITSPESK